MTMSMDAIRWAYEQQGMSMAQKTVLVALAFHFNAKEHCARPSHALLVRETCTARSTVQTALDALEGDLGLIITRPRVDDAGRQTSSLYYLPDFDHLSRPALAIDEAA